MLIKVLVVGVLDATTKKLGTSVIMRYSRSVERGFFVAYGSS